MSKQTDKSFFMFSPLAKYAGFYQELLRDIGSYQELGNRLIHSAEQAHAFRQFDTVSELGKILSNLPIKQYQSIGHYYLAIALIRHGKGDLSKAKSMFELVTDTAPLSYRARAILSLAAVLARQKDFDSELYFFVEALKESRDITTRLIASRGIAVHKSREGYHQHALKDLERMLPLMKYAPPHIYFDYLNSLAVELGEVGRKYEARNVIRHVLETPFTIAYPEWRETAEDLKGSNRSFAVIDPSPLRPRNVLAMPMLERDGAEFPTWAGQLAPVVSYQKWKSRMGKKKKGNNKPNAEDMDVRDMMFRIMEIYCNEKTTDEQRVKMWEAVEKIAANKPVEPDTPENPDDDKPGA